jgi:hypothetical protein
MVKTIGVPDLTFARQVYVNTENTGAWIANESPRVALVNLVIEYFLRAAYSVESTKQGKRV